MALDANRVLRIGVVFRGQILAERVMERRLPVTIGTRPDNAVQVSAKDHPDFPAQVELATLHKNVYHLVLPSDPSAQINLRGGPPGSSRLSPGDVVQVKGKKVVPIESYTGGSVAVGDVILMFQFVRGDSVPTTTHEEIVLRIGLVHEARLLTDRIFKPGEVVKIGSSKADDIVLPDDDYKGESAVFKVADGGQIDVSLPAKAELRLAADGMPVSEAEAISKGMARRVGDGLQLGIGLKSRGRASLGPYTLLFQVTRRTTTIPTMPRKSLLGQVFQPLTNDPVWSASFFIALLLVGSMVAQAMIFYRNTGKYLTAQQQEQHLTTTYEVLIEEKEKEEEPPPEKVQDVRSDKAKEAAKEEVKKERPKKKEPKVEKEKPQSTGKTVDPEQRKRNARKVIAKNTIAGAFMGANGATTKMFAEGGEGEATVVANSFGGDDDSGGEGPGSGVNLAGGGGGGGTVEKVKRGQAKGFGKRNSSLTKTTVKKVEKKIKVSLSAGSLSGSGAGKGGVGKVIARKSSAVRRCYEKALRKDPGLSGKVKVRFTVGTAGTITSVQVIGASGPFADCIKQKFKQIRGLPPMSTPTPFTQSYVFTKS